MSPLLSNLSSFFVSPNSQTESPVMRNPEEKPGTYARPFRTGTHNNLIPRSVLSAIILVAIFLVYRVQLDGSAAGEPVASAHLGTGFRTEAEPTETPPDGARQAIRAAPQRKERSPAGIRSDASPPVSDVGMAKAFRVDDPHAYVYTVRIGEFWDLIAGRFYSTADRLKEVNLELWHLRGEGIRPGDQMVIPGLAAADMVPPTLYTVEDGDTWENIAGTFSLTYLDLLLDNFELWSLRGLDIQAGDKITITRLPSELVTAAADTLARTSVEPPSSEQGTYVVRPGDTWERIAAETGIGALDLKRVNPTLAERALRPGDVVRVSWFVRVALMLRQAEPRGAFSAADFADLTQEELEALTVRGLAVYKEQYCGVCHQLDTAGTRGIFGPSHDGMADLAAARIEDPAYRGAATDIYAYLHESIVEPDVYFVEGFALSQHRMPTYRHISDEDLEALIVYLASQ